MSGKEEEAGMKKMGIRHQISKKKKVVGLVLAVVGLGLASLGVYFWGGALGGHADAREVPIQEAQAQIGTISDTIVGTGNLQYEEGTSITIPSGIVVNEINVEENDFVSKGDVLAVVDQVSVLRAMEDIQEEMDELDEQIDDSKDATDSESITAKTDGTVKKIYVQEGQEAAECMLEQGALLLLSIDGSAEEGEEEDELAITVATGTIEEVCVSEGEEVYAGTTLLKIASAGQSLEYQEQIAKRKELAQDLQNLLALSKSGVITAEVDGIIKSVNITAKGSTEGSEEMQDSQSAGTVVGKAERSGYISTAAQSVNISKKAVALVGSAGVSNEMTGSVEDTSEAADEEKSLTLKIMDSGVSNQEILTVESPKTGNKPQTTLSAEDGSYQGQITWKPGAKKFAAQTSYQANVTLIAGEGYLFTDSSIAQVKTGVLSGLSVTSNGKELSFCITYPFTEAEKEGTQDEEKNENAEKDNGSNKNGGTEDNNKNAQSGEENAENGKLGGNNAGNEAVVGNTGGTGSSSVGGSQNVSLVAASASTTQGSSQTNSQSSSTENSDSDSQVAAFTIASSDTMVLSVNVDELDINSVSQGQQAAITLDAIEDETFTGIVTKVGSSAGSSGGGVAKYTVEVEIPGDERMKEGMNASATITVKEQEDVVTIPVTALQERGAKVFVYTQKDSEGNLSGEQEVTTGLSDGSTVEITEGLSEGDKVYYQRVGNVSGERNFQGFGNMGQMPEGGGMPGDGEMPGGMSGGEMPSGMPGGKRNASGGTSDSRQ